MISADGKAPASNNPLESKR